MEIPVLLLERPKIANSQEKCLYKVFMNDQMQLLSIYI